MSEHSDRIVIYAPIGFKKTWAKFKEMKTRDGTSASRELRIWIKQYVKGHEPGNPQKPLTAFTPGTPEHKADTHKQMVQRLAEWAANHDGFVEWAKIREAMVEFEVPKAERRKEGDAIVLELRKLKVKIVRPRDS